MKPSWLNLRSFVVALMLGVGAQFLVGAVERHQAAADLCPFEICTGGGGGSSCDFTIEALGCCFKPNGECRTDECYECMQGWCYTPLIGCAWE